MYCVCLTVSHDPLHFIQCILLHQCTSLISVKHVYLTYRLSTHSEIQYLWQKLLVTLRESFHLDMLAEMTA
jgi:hypothetical protein